jgi:uncharacterized protein YjdB
VDSEAAALRAGDTYSIRVNGSYSDGSIREITKEAVFAADQPEVAAVDAEGRVTALKAGTANIQVSYQGMSTVVALTITPAVDGLTGLKASVEGDGNVRIGEGIQVRVIAEYENGSTADITAYAAYLSEETKIAEVDANGLITGHKVGKTDINASFEGFNASVTIKVKPPKWKQGSPE